MYAPRRGRGKEEGEERTDQKPPPVPKLTLRSISRGQMGPFPWPRGAGPGTLAGGGPRLWDCTAALGLEDQSGSGALAGLLMDSGK